MRLGHTVYSSITADRLERISNYKHSDMTGERFKNPETWRDLLDVLIYHHDPVVRHEASFLMEEYGYAIPEYLVSAVKFDKSIVAKHEAVEAMGKVKGPNACRFYRFLEKITKTPERYDPEVSHPDVQATARSAMEELKKEIGKSGK